jgi:hypothetical protein
MIDPIIDLYTVSGQHLGFFNCGQGMAFPNRHDIIKVEENVFDVVRRQIDYTVSSAKMTLFVVDVDE